MAQRVTDGHSLPSLATPRLPAVTEYRVRRGLHLRDSKMMSAGRLVSRLSIDMVKTYNRLVDEFPYRPHLHVPQKWMCRLTPCDITNQGKYTKLRNMRNDMTSFFDC